MRRVTRQALALALLLALGACAAAPEARAPEETAVRIELKVMIHSARIGAARELFRLTDEDAERFNITFYDTPAFELCEAGLILRSHKLQGGGDDTTVKLRPLACSAVAESWFRVDGFKCEEDRTGTNPVVSRSLTEDRSAHALDEVSTGTRDVASIFSESQRELVWAIAAIAPDWNRLQVIGPVSAKA